MKVKNITVVFIGTIAIILFFIFVELSTRIFLHFSRQSAAIGMVERNQQLYYQPFVMFGPKWDEKLDPFRYPHKQCRILLIGGSTAECFPSKILEDSFQKKFPDYEFQVINAAGSCYNARQELIVATIWGPNLEPDMIISLDGVNDLIHRIRMKRAGTFYLDEVYNLSLKRPFLSCFFYILRQSQFFWGMTRIKERMCIGSAGGYEDAIPIYISAQHSINVLANGLCAKRIMVLQPFHTFKYYKYREGVLDQLYARLDKELTALSQKDGVLYVNGQDAFNRKDNSLFRDDAHFTDDDGYCILADYIVNAIKGTVERF